MAEKADKASDAVDQADAQATSTPVPERAPGQPVAEATREEARAAAKEQSDAAKTADPNDDIQAAAIDVGREIAVPAAVQDVEEPDEPTVKVRLNPNFKVPVLEEYQDEQGRPRGRVKGYEAPSEAAVAVASAIPDEDDEYVDDDGRVVVSSSAVVVPAHLAADLETSPAVEVVD